MVEYALIVVLIALTCMGGMMFIGLRASQNFSVIGSTISANN